MVFEDLFATRTAAIDAIEAGAASVDRLRDPFVGPTDEAAMSFPAVDVRIRLGPLAADFLIDRPGGILVAEFPARPDLQFIEVGRVWSPAVVDRRRVVESRPEDDRVRIAAEDLKRPPQVRRRPDRRFDFQIIHEVVSDVFEDASRFLA